MADFLAHLRPTQSWLYCAVEGLRSKPRKSLALPSSIFFTLV